MGEIPSKVFRTSFLASLDAVDLITFGGFVVLVAGVWLEYDTAFALIIGGLGVMALGLVAVRGRT